MKIACIPLDIRPYNYQFLKDISCFDKRVSLILPDTKKLGHSKNGADLMYLDNFLQSSSKVDALLISADMFLYGGLFPARIHYLPDESFALKLELLKKIKQKNPNLKIYVSSLILRTPAYNSDLEEPTYYAKYGHDIFQWGVLNDKINCEVATNEDKAEFKNLTKFIPKQYLDDFINRRITNRENTLKLIKLVKLNVIEVLIIPQDDATEYGHTAIDQRIIYQTIIEENVSSSVYLHPGTDESGCTLLARAYTDFYGGLSVNPVYVTELFKNVIPYVEDRCFESSLISHLDAAGITIDIENFDFILGINGAPKIQHEAPYVYYGCTRDGTKITNLAKYNRVDISYYRDRNFNAFTKKLQKYQNQNVPITILDAAFCNGGEFAFVDYLDRSNLLEYIESYAGWNTTCNSLGSLITATIFGLNGDRKLVEEFKMQRLVNDLVYCSKVCVETARDFLPVLNAKYDNFNGKTDVILNHISKNCEKDINKLFSKSYKNKKIRIRQVNAPFYRLTGLEFEVEIMEESSYDGKA